MSAVRVVYAFILAPALLPALWIVGALVLGSRAGAGIGLVALAFFAYLPALVLGVPIYLIAMRRGVLLTPLRAAIVGAVIAAAPWFAAFAGRLSFDDAAQALLLFSGLAGGCGAVSGLAFWAVAAWRVVPASHRSA